MMSTFVCTFLFEIASHLSWRDEFTHLLGLHPDVDELIASKMSRQRVLEQIGQACMDRYAAAHMRERRGG